MSVAGLAVKQERTAIRDIMISLRALALTVALVAGLVFNTATKAGAATVSYGGTEIFPESNGLSWDQILPIPRFDPRLGTLQAIDMTAWVTVRASASANMSEANYEGTSTFVRPGVEIQLGLGGPFLPSYHFFNGLYGNEGSTLSIYCNGNGPCSSDEVERHAFGTIGGDLTNSALDDWVFGFYVSAAVSDSAFGQLCYDGDCAAHFDIVDVKMSGKVEWSLSLYYEPAPLLAPVPVPVSGVLMLAGLSVIGFVGGRRMPR